MGIRPFVPVTGIPVLKNHGKIGKKGDNPPTKNQERRGVSPFPGIPPGRSGVYLFRDGLGEVLYVGKAKCLRKRLAQYPLAVESLDQGGFQKHMADIWTASERVDWLPVPDELGALVLEMELVGRIKPRFNRALNPPPRRLLWLIHQPGQKKPLRFVADPNQEGEVLFGPIRGGLWTSKVLEALVSPAELDNPAQFQVALDFAKGESVELLRILDSLSKQGTESPGLTTSNVESIIRRITVLKAFDQRRIRQNLALALCGYFPIGPLGPGAWNHPIIPGRRWYYAIWNGRIRGVIEIKAMGKFPEKREELEQVLVWDPGELPVAKGPEEPLLIQAWLDRSPENSQSFVCAQTSQSPVFTGSA